MPWTDEHGGGGACDLAGQTMSLRAVASLFGSDFRGELFTMLSAAFLQLSKPCSPVLCRKPITYEEERKKDDFRVPICAVTELATSATSFHPGADSVPIPIPT